jgi:rod shape-determining protein MreC
MQAETRGKRRPPFLRFDSDVRSLLKRFREPIFVIGLLAFSFGVFFIKAKKPRDLNPFERFVVDIFLAPAERAIVAGAFGVIETWQGYVALRGVREENLLLREDNLRSHMVLQTNAELKLENERLRRLLDYADKSAPMRFVPARVVAVGASPHSHTLRIHRGSGDGIHKGDAVISPDGIVGTVSNLTASYADVQLIVNPLSAVAAVSQRTRSRSTVKGSGDISRCKLEYALRTDDLQEGDLLVTAAGAGLFPPGLRVGTATNVRRAAAGMFLQAEVVPAVNFARLDEVLVVVQDVPKTATDVASVAGAAP